MMETVGYVFPNDLHIHWSLMIVIYPFITGLVDGAFVVSSFYNVFGFRQLKPVARFSLVAALAFLLVATWPLLNHLGHPVNGVNVVLTPVFGSAMAGFGFFYTGVLFILLFQVWLLFREDIVVYAKRTRGLKQRFYRILTLGVYDISEEALQADHRVTTFLAAIGLPAAILLHGYAGFMFGGIKANPYWSTPLMSIIFIFSAVVSGIAAIIVMYQVIMKLKGFVIDRACIDTLCGWLWLFLIITVSLEILAEISLAYAKSEQWEIVHQLLQGPLSFSYMGLQMVMGALIPFILLGIIVLMRRNMSDKVTNTLSFTAAALLLVQVFAMRWNVVIGGQMISKSLIGFRESYVPGMFEKEGVLAGVLIMIVPFVIILFAEKFFPMFGFSEEQTKEVQASPPPER